MSMIGLLLSAAGLAWPDSGEAWTPPRTMRLEEPASGVALRVDAQAWWAIPIGWLLITRGSRAGSGDHMDIGSDVDLDPSVAPVVQARLALGEAHGVALRFSRVDASGTRTADGTFIYHGDVYNAGRRVQAEARFVLLEGDTQYSFAAGETFRLTGHAGAHYWKYTGHARTVDGGPPLDSQRNFDSAFWMAGLDLSWRAAPSVEIRAQGVGAIQRAHQNFFKVEADALVSLGGSAALTIGYRLHAIRFRQSTNRSNIKFHGPTFGLEMTF
jgi:hypothetical protein